MKDKTIIDLLLFMVVGLMLIIVVNVNNHKPCAHLTREFANVPTDSLHTMRVWEDGSFEVVYQDGTSELGCLNNGLCQD